MSVITARRARACQIGCRRAPVAPAVRRRDLRQGCSGSPAGEDESESRGDGGAGGKAADARLRRWANWLSEQADSGLACYVYFNNDGGGHAPRDAARLRAMLPR